jgi:hypothetical protein
MRAFREPPEPFAALCLIVRDATWQPVTGSPLRIAVDALEVAKGALEQLPSTDEVRDLQRRWYALRTVVHGVVVSRVPAITAEQESKLMERTVSFAREVIEVWRRLRATVRPGA